MLKNVLIFRNLCSNSIRNCEIIKNAVPNGTRTLFEALKCDTCCLNQYEGFHTNLPRLRLLDDSDGSLRSARKIAKNKVDEGVYGSASMEFDSMIKRYPEMFPDEKLSDTIYNGVPFCELPIVHIRSSRNNMIVSLTNKTGKVLMIRSCGVEGFKNVKKGTTVAAQGTATTFGIQAVKAGFDTVRVAVNGLGPGRLSGVKGLMLSGLKIVSVTDTTPFSDNPPRSKKRRRI